MQPAWLPVQSTAPQVPQLQVPPTHNTGVPISAQGWNSMQPTQPYPYYPHPQQTTQPQQVSNPQGFHRVMPTNHPPTGDTNTHPKNPTQQVSALVTHSNNTSQTMLQIASTKVRTGDGEVSQPFNLMLDSASNRSYATTEIIRKVRPPQIGTQNVSYNSFGEEASSKPTLRSVYNFQIITLDGDTISVPVIEVPHICQAINTTVLPDHIRKHFQHLNINEPNKDTHTGEKRVKIQILIGVDHYWSLVRDSPPQVRHNNIVAIPTHIGWILSGSFHESNANCNLSIANPECVSTILISVTETQVESFWDLETVGILPTETENIEDPVLTRFYQSLEYSDTIKSYRVSLPWKSMSARASLGNNLSQACKRLEDLHRRILDKDPVLKEAYNQVFFNYFNSGIIEKIPNSEILPFKMYTHPIFYLPHRPIIKASSSSPVRPVFDGSAPTHTGVSLNQAVSQGPSLYPDMVQIIVRFRRWKIGLTGDIRQAFLNIFMNPIDKDCHRFLLYANKEIIHARFTRVPFGNSSSPFLLNATIKWHLSTFPDSPTLRELKKNLFVDNLLTGADTVEEAEMMYKEACEILKSGGFELDKWSSNSQNLMKKFTNDQVCVKSSKLLGLEWDMDRDVIFYSCASDQTECPQYTKRSILSVLCSIFDPLGIISPYILYGKILFQRVWKLGVQQNWDTPLPDALCVSFHDWLKSSREFENFSCPRAYFPQTWSLAKSTAELIAFGDASPDAYGAVVYLRIFTEAGYEVAFITAKTRVAPVKKQTLPRLELLGALLAARLASFAKISLELTDAEVSCYTDSTIALHWIKGNNEKYKPFVANRIATIQDIVPPKQWYHCPGVHNPADVASRGSLGHDLIKNSMWINGPLWLKTYKCYPQPSGQISYQTEGTDSELKNTNTVCVTQADTIDSKFAFKSLSKYNRVINVLCYVLRFIHNCRTPIDQRETGPLNNSETTVAEPTLWRITQKLHFPEELQRLKEGKPLNRNSKIIKLSPYLDHQGIIRVQGRLQNSHLSMGAKHPIILPNSYVVFLLIRFIHVFTLNHAGIDTVLAHLRENYWIIKARRLCKTIIKYCVQCQRVDKRPCNQIAPPLPGFRVVKNKPFAVIGIDFCGPLFCKYSKNKWYILLITCGVVRAIHLELTPSLNLKDFLNSFSRFTSRRGVPELIISDNATTFEAASRQMANLHGPQAPTWNFIAPRSPWWGGWYERLVRSVKNSLKKSIGLRSLARVDLEVTILKIEDSINNRPITVNTDQTPLKPRDFLIPNAGSQEVPHDRLPDTNATILNGLAQHQKAAMLEYWGRWHTEYISNLPHLVSKHFQNNTVSVGDLVLLNDNNHKINNSRLTWPLCKITKLHTGRDNLVRSVDIMINSGTLTRAIQRLHKIELSPHNFNDTEHTLSGRNIK